MAASRVLRRRILKSVGAAVILVVVTAVITLGVLAGIARDPDGRVWLLHGGLAVLNRQSDWRIDIDDAASPGVGEWSLRRLRLYRRGELSFSVTGLELRFDWRALSDHRVLVHRMRARKASVYPGPGGSDAGEEPTPVTLPQVDIRPWSVVVEAIAVDQLQWLGGDAAEPLLPPIQLKGEWALWQGDVPLRGTLTGRSLQTGAYSHRPVAEFAVTSRQPDPNRLLLTVEAKEPAGGWFAGQLGVPSGQALAIDTALALEDRGDTLDLQLERMTFPWQGHRLAASATLTVQRDGSGVTIRQGELTVDERRQVVSGQWRPDHLDLTLQLDRWPLTVFTPWYDALQGGQISGEWRVTGAVASPAVSGNGRFTATVNEAAGRWRAEGTVHGDYQSGVLALEQAALGLDWSRGERAAHGRIKLNGRMDFNTPHLAVSGSASRLDSELVTQLLQRFAVPVPEVLKPLQVRAALERFAIDGPMVGQWRDVGLQLRGELDGLYRQTPVRLTVAGNGSWQRFTLDSATLAYADARLSGQGEVDLFGNHNDFSVEWQQLSMALLRDLPPPLTLPSAVPQALAGAFSGTAQVRGELRRPRARFSLDGALQGGGLPQPADVALRGHSEPNRVYIDALQVLLQRASETVGRFDLEGHVDTHGPVPAMRWQMQTRDLPLALVAPDSWPDNGGQISGRLQLDVPAADAIDADWLSRLQASGEFDLRSGTLAVAGQSGESSPVSVRWFGDLADTESGAAIRLRSRVQLRPQASDAAPVDAGDLRLELDKAALGRFMDTGQTLPEVNLKTQLDMRALAFTLPVGIDLGGRLEADLALAGAVTAPRLRGSLRLAEAFFASEDLGLTLRPITLEARARERTLQIEAFRAEDGRGGYFAGNGRIQWRDPDAQKAVALNLRAQDLRLLERQEIQGNVTGDLQLTGSLRRMLLAGKLEVEPLDVSISGNLPGADIPTLKVSYERETQEQASASWLPTLMLDVGLHADKRAYLRGRGLDAELSGNLQLTGNVDKPTLTGEFNVVRGHFELLGYRFNLVEGNASISDASLSLLATGKYNKSGREITATLTATHDQADFRLSSDPAMPEDEILAWLMFGKSIESISAAQAVQVASAVSTLRGGSFDPIGTTRDLLGVDTLVLDTEETEQGTGLSIGAGKYLTDRVYLELERTPDPAEPWRSSLTIELTPLLNLRSTMSTGSSSEGVELEWYRDY